MRVLHRQDMVQERSNVGHQTTRQPWFPILVFVTLLVALAVRLVGLDQLPGELYGDIAIVYEYVHDIREGRWPVWFVLSAGPLYHYVITPIVWITGLDYLGLKLASVVVSLGVLLTLYALASELWSRELALLAVFIAGVSSWLLIFSRLGNSQILVPLLSTGALYFAVRAVRREQIGSVVACAVVSALGLFTYPQSFILPLVTFVVIGCLTWGRAGMLRRYLAVFAAVSLICAVPFALIVSLDPANFFSGYIGGKFRSDRSLFIVLLDNFIRGLSAFHIRGDLIFRSNPASLPHLDPVSGLLFIGGVFFWLQPERRRLSPALFVPFILLQLPSMFVLRYPQEVPSASRTLGVAPIAYLLVASGVWWGFSAVRKRRWLAWTALLAVLVLINWFNLHRYFRLYADGLPNHNTPFGRIIADYIDQLDPQTQVYLVGCCWGEWGQPEPKGILYETNRPEDVQTLTEEEVSCSWLQEVEGVVIWSPARELPAPQLRACAGLLEPKRYESERGDLVFQYSFIESTALRR